MRQPVAPTGSGAQAKVLDISVPSRADVVVLKRRPEPALRPGDLVSGRRPLRAPGPGEVVVRNLITSVDPYQRMLRGSPEVTPAAIGEPGPGQQCRGGRGIPGSRRAGGHPDGGLHRLAGLTRHP